MKLTAAIPFYNAEATLADAIRSIFAQTFQDWELLLIDDGSTDKSLEIARSVHDPRVKVFGDGSNKGLSYRLNQIAQLASGEYLARMDADDLCHPERFAKQVTYLDQHPSVVVVDTALCSISLDNTPEGIRGDHELITTGQAILKMGLLQHPTIIGRTDWFRSNAYDSTYPRAEDRELWCRTYSPGLFARIPQPLYFYREAASIVLKPSNTLQSFKFTRRIYMAYGTKFIGVPQTVAALIESYAKSLILIAAVFLRQQKALSRYMLGRRNSAIELRTAQDVRQAIEIVLNTSVPGLLTNQ